MRIETENELIVYFPPPPSNRTTAPREAFSLLLHDSLAAAVTIFSDLPSFSTFHRGPKKDIRSRAALFSSQFSHTRPRCFRPRRIHAANVAFQTRSFGVRRTQRKELMHSERPLCEFIVNCTNRLTIVTSPHTSQPTAIARTQLNM